MKVMITGGEKFKLWRTRNDYGLEEINSIIQAGISDVAMSFWCSGTTIPRPAYKKRIYEWSKRISVAGRHKLVISVNDWRVQSYLNVYCGEALRLWRFRNGKMTTRELAKMVGCSHTTIIKIENGDMPSDEMANKIDYATSGFLTREHWLEELKYISGEIKDDNSD